MKIGSKFGLVSGGDHLQCLKESLSQSMQIDLFDPPQREEFREQVVSLRANGYSEKSAAKELGITHTAAQRAAALHRLMQHRGLQDPYVLVTEPPLDYNKLSRHLHPRYHFVPLDDLVG